jgi:uncharacterized membrane protein
MICHGFSRISRISRIMNPFDPWKSVANGFPNRGGRLAYLDWMRGLACVLMFQTHAYDSWLGGGARKSTFFMWSQLGGTLPAPLFLFLAGISFALVTQKLRQRGTDANQVAATTIRRGGEIFALGLLFRLQEFLLGWPGAPWTDLLRVDILNIIGLAMMLMGVLCRVMSGRAVRAMIAAAGGVAFAIALITPMMWNSWRMPWLPWPVESYLCGVHTFGQPQAWLFPIFPWVGFAFAGLAIGLGLMSDWGRHNELVAVAAVGGLGLALIAAARWLDHLPRQIYPVYDFWHTSPNFFAIRVGILMLIVLASYAWCRWGAAQWGFSPLIQLGQTSLLVYWVHIEFVYGRFSILPKRAMTVAGASAGLAIIFVAMVALSIARTRMKGRGIEVMGWKRRAAAGA